jgi:hypothetical protein
MVGLLDGDPIVDDVVESAALLPALEDVVELRQQLRVVLWHRPAKILGGQRPVEPRQRRVLVHEAAGDAPHRRRILDEEIDLVVLQRRDVFSGVGIAVQLGLLQIRARPLLTGGARDVADARLRPAIAFGSRRAG